jgi:hypothetical protein
MSFMDSSKGDFADGHARSSSSASSVVESDGPTSRLDARNIPMRPAISSTAAAPIPNFTPKDKLSFTAGARVQAVGFGVGLGVGLVVGLGVGLDVGMGVGMDVVFNVARQSWSDIAITTHIAVKRSLSLTVPIRLPIDGYKGSNRCVL